MSDWVSRYSKMVPEFTDKASIGLSSTGGREPWASTEAAARTRVRAPETGDVSYVCVLIGTGACSSL